MSVTPEIASTAAPAPRPGAGAAVSIARRLGHSLLTSGGTLAASIGTYLGLSRAMDPAEYGRAAVVLALWGLAFNTVDWAGPILVRFGPVELSRSGSLRVSIVTRLVFAVPPLLLLFVALPPYLSCSRGYGAALIALTLAFLVAATVQNVGRYAAVSAQRFGALGGANALMKGTPLVLVLAALASGRSGHALHAEGYLVASFVGTLAAAALLAFSLRDLWGTARPDRALLGDMWRYGRPMLVGMPACAAVAWADPLLLDRYASRAEVGRYGLAYPTFVVYAAVGEALNAVLSPELVRKSAARDPLAVARYRDVGQPRGAFALALLGFAGACFAEPVVRLALPASYAESARLVALLGVAGGFLIAFWTLLPLVTAADRMGSQQVGHGVQAVVNVALDVALAPRFGAVGIALANVAAWAAAYVTLALLLSRAIGGSLRSVLAVCVVGGAVAAVVAGGAPLAVRAGVGCALLAVGAAMGLRLWRERR